MTNQSLLKRGLVFFNYKLSIVGAIVMGSIVFYINYSHAHGPVAAGIAGMKQFIYTFFMGGVLLRLLDYFLSKMAHSVQGVIFSVLLNSLITVILIYFVHSFKGTPEPFYSTIPTIILAPFGFMSVAIQKGYLKKESMDLKKASS